MSNLLAARNDLATALEGAGHDTHAHVPDAINPPCLVIQPSENYLTINDDDLTFSGPGEYIVTCDVYALANLYGSEQALDDLDDLTTHVLGALPGGWWLDSMGQPDNLRTGDWLAYGNRITVKTSITINS